MMVRSDQSQLMQLLDRVDRELPAVDLNPTERQEALGLIASLREAIIDKVPDAGVRTIGAALASLLKYAGSDLWQSVCDAFGIEASGAAE